jgi:hypothetical protein
VKLFRLNRFVALTAAAAVTTVMTVASASATTIGFAEGSRSAVPGVTIIANDVQGMPARAFNVGTLGAGDVINIFGAISNNFDGYAFDVTAKAFRVSLIGEGLVPRGSTASQTSVVVNLLEGVAPYTILDDVFLATSALPGNPVLFRGPTGSYVIQVDGTATAGAADYDLQIAAVPLPAAGLLLLAGLGALGVAGRRRKMAVA